MKRIFTSAVILLGVAITYAQYDGRVGVNTETPAATMDIKSKTGTDATTKNLELQNTNGIKLLTVLDDGIIGETSRAGKRFGLSTYDAYDAYLGTGTLNYLPDGTTSGYTSSSFLYVSSTDTKDRRFRVEINNYNPTLTTEEFFINSKGNVYIGKQLEVGKEVQEKLEVVGNIKSTNLAGTGDRAVFADENGVLKTGTMSIKASTTNATCSATNEGTMHYKLVEKNSKQVGLFGFCTRDANGEFLWAYQLGGNNMFSVSGNQAFGTGL